ncbi:MAG: acyl-CoA desaturase [Pseudomonadales bacterium]|nr:acyl-CoA desaturase [Pseudomonadales bacterium]
MISVNKMEDSNGQEAVQTAAVNRNHVLSSPYLQKMQVRAARLTIIVPTVGSIMAIVAAMVFEFSAFYVALWLSMHLITMLGITVGYHRLSAHRSFETTNNFVRSVLVIMGSMAAQGPVIHWVSNHRRHHEFSDEEEDTHSPHKYELGEQVGKLNPISRLCAGIWHAHIGWMFNSKVTNPSRYSRDLLKDPLVAMLNKRYPHWVVLGVVVPGLLGALFAGNIEGLILGVLWGGMLRIFTVHHSTWAINSITHLFGRRPYATSEKSTNNIWIVLPSAGEAWHNHHHAFPTSARFGFEWWQVDLGYILIRFLALFNLVKNVKEPTDKAKLSKMVSS